MDGFPDSLLQRYRPDWIIGRGRSGVVWAVTDLETGRALAMKFLELSVLAHGWPRHAHLVEVVTQPRWDLLAMERVRGTALRDWPLPGRSLPVAKAASLLLPMLDAVRVLHEAGIAHGGLHGGNVMVRGPGDPVLMEPMTGRVPVLGAAPEILCGEVPHAGSDVWALGVLAHVLLTGAAPHPGAPEAMRRMILEEPLAAPGIVNPKLPRSLEAWLLRALARSAARRFADAREMLGALRAALAELPPSADAMPPAAYRPA
jgi:serine/threonine-protein kinase